MLTGRAAIYAIGIGVIALVLLAAIIATGATNA